MYRPILLATVILASFGLMQACSSSDSGGTGGTAGAGGGSGGSGPGPAGPGPGPSTGASMGGDCDAVCGKAKTAGCESMTCVADCNNNTMIPPKCQTEYKALIACGASKGTVTCNGANPKINGCDAEGNALVMCITGGAGGAGPGVGGGGNCYAGQGTCDPLTPGSCPGAGDACDIGMNGFECFPAPNDAQIGGMCNNMNGPFCVNGAACVAMKCEKYCCDDTDCAGMTCTSKGMQGNIDVRVCE